MRGPALQARFILRLFMAFTLMCLFSNVALAGEWLWNITAAGNWNAPANWSPNTTFPNAIDDIASVTNDISTARTISLQQPEITIGTLNIGDRASGFVAFTIATGTGGTLTFDVSGAGHAAITKNTNTVVDIISAPITLNDDLDINLLGSSGGITISGNIDEGVAGKAITELGTGTGVLILSGYNTFGGGVTLSNGYLTVGSATALGTGMLTISNGVLNTSVPLVLTNNNQIALNGDFTFPGAYNLDLGDGLVTMNATRRITVTANTLTIGGAISGDNFGLTKLGAGTLRLTGANTYSGRTSISNGTLRVTSLNMVSGGSASSSLGAPTTVANGTIDLGSNTTAGTLRYTGDGETSDRVINLAGTTGGGIIQNDGSGAITFTSDLTATGAGAKTLTLQGSNTLESTISGNITNSSSATSLTKAGIGTWVLAGGDSSGSNTFTGATAINGGGTLILDYSTKTSSKLANASALTLGGAAFGGTLTLCGGSHTEIVSATTLNAGTFRITQSNGASTLRMNTITRSAGGTIDFGATNIAQIDTTNYKGILGGYATVAGTDWTTNATTDGPVKAYTNYTAFPTTGGSTNFNYSLIGSTALTGPVSNNTLKIANSGASDILNLGANNLTFTYSSATILGGLLYVGGFDNNYTISGTGKILTTSTTGELIINVNVGTLTISAPIVATGATAGTLTKTGSGTLVLSAASTYTGAMRINQGVVNVRNATATGSTGGGIQVAPGAALELQGEITVGAEAINPLTGAGVTNSGALRNISGNNTYGGAITLGVDGARINSDSGTLTRSGTLVTAALRDLTIGGAGNVTNTGVISGAGRLIKDGAGTLTLSVANTFTGGTTIRAGTVMLGIAAGLGAAATAMLDFSAASHATFQLNGFAQTMIGLSGDNMATVENGSATACILTINNGDDRTYAGLLQNGGAGTLALTKNGPGTLTLSNTTNSYTGITTLSAGILSVPTLADGGVACSIGAAPVAAGNLVLTGGTLRYTGTTTNINRSFTLTAAYLNTIEITEPTTTLTISGASTAVAGNLTKTGSGTLVLSGANLHTGTTRVKAGTLRYGANNALASGPVVISGTNAVFNIGSYTDSVGQVTLTAGSITCTNAANRLFSTVNPFTMNGEVDTFVSANLAGAIGLTKSGAGTLILNGSNTYTKVTLITCGTLQVDGSLNGIGQVIATNSGILAGTGTVAGAVFIYTNSALAPGSNSVGTLTVTNGVTFTGGTFMVNVTTTNSGDYGQVKVKGGNVIITNAVLAFNGLGGYEPERGHYIWIINNTGIGPVSGEFDGLPEGGETNIASTAFTIYYNADLASRGTNGGNDVLLVSITTKQIPTMTNWGSASAITYGQALSNSTLSGFGATNAAGANVPGSVAFNAPTATPNAGTTNAAVTFTPTDSAHYNTVAGNMDVVVSKATQAAITFAPTATQTYNTTNGLSATGGSGTGAFSYAVQSGPGTIDGTNLTATSGTGTITVRATKAADDNYNAATQDAEVVAQKASQAAIAFHDLTQTYDGTARVVTNTTDPAGLTVNITYDGNTWAPTNAASYAVTGVVDDVNYQGTNTNTLVVSKINLTLSGIIASNKVYDGNTTATIISYGTTNGIVDSDIDNVAVDYSGASAAFDNFNVGDGKTVTVSGLTLSGTAAGNYLIANQTTTGNIIKADQTISGFTPADGSVFTTTSTVGLAAQASSALTVTFALASGPGSLTGDTNLTFTGVGPVSIKASQAGDGNWNAAPDVINTFSVLHAATPTTNSIPFFDDFEAYTNGTPLVDGINGWYGSSPGIVVQQDEKYGGLQAAMIPVDCVLSNQFVPATTTNVWIQMDLRPALYEGTNPPTVNTNVAFMFYINSNGNFVVHNGPATNPSPTDSLSWVTLTNFNVDTNGTNWVTIGIYEDFTRKQCDLYTDGVLVTNNIKFINQALTNFTGLGACNGVSTSYLDNVSATVSNRTAGGIGLSTTTLTFAATYTTATSNQTLTVVMTNLGQSAFMFSNTVTYGSGSDWLTFTPVEGELTGSATQVLTGTVNSVSLTSGVYVATNTISSPDATNAPQIIVATLTVSKATAAAIAFYDLAQTYDGAERVVTNTTDPAGLTVNITYDGNTWAPTNAGSYAVTGVVDDVNYQGTNTNTLVVSKRAITVTAANNVKVYDGTTSATGMPTITSGSLTGTDTAAWSETYDNANVGTGKTLTPAGSVTDGNGGNNYTVTFTDITTGEITPPPPSRTVTFDGWSQAYNTTTGMSASVSVGTGTWTFTVISGPGTIDGTNLWIGYGDVTVQAEISATATNVSASNSAIVSVVMPGPVTNSIPWSDNFESYYNGTPLINGITGWYASASSCIVQTNVKHTGSQAALIPLGVTLSNRFDNTLYRIVRIEMYVQPQLYNGANSPAIFTNVAAQFFVNSNGYFVVGNGTNWNEATTMANGADAIPVTNTYFTRIQVNLRYKNHTWNLQAWTNGTDLVVSTYYLNFASNLNAFSGFNIDNSNSTSYADEVSLCGRYISYVDDVSVTNIDFNLLPQINDVPFDAVESINDAQPAEIDDIINE